MTLADSRFKPWMPTTSAGMTIQLDIIPLAFGAAHDVHQLFDLAPLIGLVAGGGSVPHAVRDGIAQHFFLETPQRRAHRRDLGDDVDAVAIVLDHARNAAHLALDAVQPFRARLLDVIPHAGYIPPYGISGKAAESGMSLIS